MIPSDQNPPIKIPNKLDFYTQYYEWQFISNETVAYQGQTFYQGQLDQHFKLQHHHILRCSATGTIYLNGKAIQTFVAEQHEQRGRNYVVFCDIGYQPTKCVVGYIVTLTGDLFLQWQNFQADVANPPVVSYEYSWAENEPKKHTLNRSDLLLHGLLDQ